MCQGVCRVLSGRRGGEDRWATGERSALPLFHIPGRRGEHTPRGTPSRWRLSAEIINLHTWQRAVFFPGPTMSMSARRGCDASQPRAAAPSQPVFSFSAPRAGGARNGFVDTVDQLQVFSLHFSPPLLFFFFSPPGGDPVTVGRSPWAVVFSLRNKVSRGFPLTEEGGRRGKVLFVAVYPAHPTPEALFLISPAKRSANAAQACPTTLAVVSALRNTLCKSGQETLWSEAFLFFFLPKFLRGHRQCFVERRGTTTGVFLHQALYTVRPLLALSLLVYEGLRHFFSLLFFSLSLLGIKP